MAEKQDIDDLDMIAYTPEESEEEPFNTAIDNTSEDPTIVMGRPVTSAFVSDDIRVPTKKVGCLQVTSQLQEFLNHFPPESKEKAFEQIYQILQVLDTYLSDNPQQHPYCMSPDSEYISLIMYATKLEIDLCNFLAICAVLSILLDTQSNELQYVKNLQQVVDDYYDKHPTEVMSRLEHQITDIMNAMYDSITNDNFDSISDDTDRVSGAVDYDYCYIVRLGLNWKFIDLLFKCSFIKFIEISFHLDFIVSEIIYKQTDTLTQELMYLR